jgi:hypothetical protein
MFPNPRARLNQAVDESRRHFQRWFWDINPQESPMTDSIKNRGDGSLTDVVHGLLLVVAELEKRLPKQPLQDAADR